MIQKYAVSYYFSNKTCLKLLSTEADRIQNRPYIISRSWMCVSQDAIFRVVRHAKQIKNHFNHHDRMDPSNLSIK